MLADCFSYSRSAVFSGVVCFSSVASATTFVIPGPVTPPIVPVVPRPVTPTPVDPVLPPPVTPEPYVPVAPPPVIPVPPDSACGELESSLTAIGSQAIANEHVNVAYCHSLFPSGFECGGEMKFNIESRESSGAQEKRIRYLRPDALIISRNILVTYTDWQSCGYVSPETLLGPVEPEIITPWDPVQPGIITPGIRSSQKP